MAFDAPIAVVGLATMGQNLARNIARNGFRVAVWNREPEMTAETIRLAGKDAPMRAASTPEELCTLLERPRRIVLLIRAGQPIDDTIARFLPHLERGDLLIDGGNSHPDDTERRAHDLAQKGIRFTGMGVSGGAEGALMGPSLMPGGEKSAYDELYPILSKIAAKVEDGPCVAHLGNGASGHFVKMVHNGIEYGDMQLIAECFDVMQNVLSMTHEQMADTFAEWNKGVLESFLIEITSKILREPDPKGGLPLVEKIVDKAGQKGTGQWTAEIALRHGVPVPTMRAAVEARGLSSMRDLRIEASKTLRGPSAAGPADASLVDALRDALYCSKICSYAQGLDLIATVDREKGWGIDLSEVARIWKGGCIIRARFLQRIQQAYGKGKKLANLLLDQELGGFLVERQSAWRRVVALGAERGIPMLAMAGSLSYFDSFRRARLPQNLTQAQRDFFGSHTFERTDGKPGEFVHHEWRS